MIVISTLLNSCVVVLTNSPRAVNFSAWANCSLSMAICCSRLGELFRPAGRSSPGLPRLPASSPSKLLMAPAALLVSRFAANPLNCQGLAS